MTLGGCLLGSAAGPCQSPEYQAGGDGRKSAHSGHSPSNLIAVIAARIAEVGAQPQTRRQCKFRMSEMATLATAQWPQAGHAACGIVRKPVCVAV